MEIGNRLKELRKEKNKSQEEMALDINVSRQTISKWENGTVIPDSFNVNLLSQYFNVSVDYILNGDDTKVNDIKNIIVKKEQIIDIVMITLGLIFLVFGILFTTVDSFKDSINVSAGSSFVSIPIGIIMIVLSIIIIIVFIFLLIKNIRKQ